MLKKGEIKQPTKTQKVKLNFKMYKKEGLTTTDYCILTDKGGWEDENEKGKNKRTNTPEEMGNIQQEGIKWNIADKNSEKH